MKLSRIVAVPLGLLCAALALAPLQAETPVPGASPLISVAPIDTVVVTRGGKVPLNIAMQVNRGFHVNSNRPNDELLLPTAVHLSPPEGVVITNIAYPEAEELALPFAGKDKLSVYSGSFEVTAEVHVPKSAALGTLRVHGIVKYQACDNRQCFPPKITPLQFDVKVVSSAKSKKSTFTPASPHIH